VKPLQESGEVSNLEQQRRCGSSSVQAAPTGPAKTDNLPEIKNLMYATLGRSCKGGFPVLRLILFEQCFVVDTPCETKQNRIRVLSCFRRAAVSPYSLRRNRFLAAGILRAQSISETYLC
jgi:hypothetical protein